MTKAVLTRTWAVLHVVAAIVLGVALDRLLVDLQVGGGTRVLVVVAAVLAWVALGVLGVLLATAVRDGMGLGRRLRGVVADLADRQASLVRSLRDLRRELTDLRGTMGELTDSTSTAGAAQVATTEAVTGIDDRVDRLEGGLDQLGRDLAGSLRAQAERLDDLAGRRRSGEDRDTAG